MRFKKVFSNLELEGQGCGIIMEVTRLLLLGSKFQSLSWIHRTINLTRFFFKFLWFFFNLSIALNKLLWFQRLNSLGLPQHEVWPLTHPFLRSFWKSKKQEIYSTTIEIEFTIQGRRNKGADHTHHITIRPSDYQTFLRPCRRGEILYAIRSM